MIVNLDTKVQILKAIHNRFPKMVVFSQIVNLDTKVQILKAIHNR